MATVLYGDGSGVKLSKYQLFINVMYYVYPKHTHMSYVYALPHHHVHFL